MVRTVGTACTLVALLLLGSSSSFANIIVDGGFENPVQVDANCFALPGCQGFDVGSSIGAWTVVGTGTPTQSVLLLKNTYAEGALVFNSGEGVQSLDLSGAGNLGHNGVRQTVSTLLGGSYELRFLVGNADNSFANYAHSSIVELVIDNISQGNFTNSNNTANGINWLEYSFNFIAAGTSTQIEFFNANPTGEGADNESGLDNVRLEAIPEPASLSLFGFGVIMLSRLRRRKK